MHDSLRVKRGLHRIWPKQVRRFNIFVQSQARFALLVAKWSWNFIIFINFVIFENHSAFSCDYLSFIIDVIASSIDTSSSLVFENISTSLISTVADDDIISIFIDVKFTNQIIHLEFWQLSHPLRWQSLSLFLLLKPFEILKNIVDKVLSHLVGCLLYEFMLIYRFFINLLVVKVSIFYLLEIL